MQHFLAAWKKTSSEEGPSRGLHGPRTFYVRLGSDDEGCPCLLETTASLGEELMESIRFGEHEVLLPPILHATSFAKSQARHTMNGRRFLCALLSPTAVLNDLFYDIVSRPETGLTVLTPYREFIYWPRFVETLPPDVQEGCLVKSLQEGNMDATAVISQSSTACFQALANVKLELLPRLLSLSSTRLDTRDAIGRTPLHVAAQRGDSARVSFLIERGATVDATDVDGITSLHLAINGDHLSAVVALLKAGASPNLPTAGGDSPLGLACMGSTVAILEALLSVGMAPNSWTSSGQSLIFADICKLDRPVETIRMLLTAGASFPHWLAVFAPLYMREEVAGLLSRASWRPFFAADLMHMTRVRRDILQLKEKAVALLVAANVPRAGSRSPLHPLHMGYLGRLVIELLAQSYPQLPE